MGRRLLALAHADPELTVTGAVEAAGHPALGASAGAVLGEPSLEVPITDDVAAALAKADAVISFALPEATLACVAAAADAGVACVVGTTGLGKEQDAELSAAAGRIALVQAANFSLGVNLLWKVAEEVAARVGLEFDMEVVEMHHNQKVDAPSGTALRLAEGMARGAGRTLDEAGVYGRHGHVGKRTKTEIGVLALRGGDVVGEHTAIFAGVGERLELTHRATSRDNFAKGALVAARWTRGRTPGRYDMFDVLGLRPEPA